MHSVYTTDGMILATRPLAEADILTDILTTDFGLLSVVVKAARKQESKHRHALQLFSKVRCSLVKGERVWRLTGIAVLRQYYPALSKDVSMLKSFARVARLVRRLIPDEGATKGVYPILVSAADFLETADPSLVAAAELCAVINILHVLGYVGETAELADVYKGSVEKVSVEALLPHMKLGLKVANDALNHSHL